MNMKQSNMLSVVLLAFCIGCGVSEANPNDHWSVDEPQPPTDPSTPPKTVTPEPVTSALICAPKANVWSSNWEIAPTLRQWVLDAEKEGCSLENRDAATPSTGQLNAASVYGKTGSKQCDKDGCWVTLPSTIKSWQEKKEPTVWQASSSGRWVGTIDARRHSTGQLEATLTAARYSSTALQTFTRRWDRKGRILSTRHAFGGNVWFESEHTWRDGLLRQSAVTDHINGTKGADYVYEYDEKGRLILGTMVHRKHGDIQTVRWTYNKQHPTSVERTHKGQLWLSQSWSFDEHNHVTAHNSTYTREHAPSYHQHVLDDHTPSFEGTQLQWDRQRYHSTPSCDRLPIGLTYGYPEADGAYHLGWSVSNRPGGVDQRYGFPALYVSADLGWFGHQGASIGYLQQANSIQSTTSYINRTMHRATNVSTLQDGTAVEMTRQRTFDAGRLVEDRLTNKQEQPERVMTFEYDGQGQLIDRKLRWDDALVAQQTWSYKPGQTADRCRVSAHHIGFSSKHIDNQWQSISSPTESLDASLDVQGSYFVSSDDACQNTTQTSSFDDQFIHIQYDDKDRVIAQNLNHSSVTFVYNQDNLSDMYRTYQGKDEPMIKHTFDSKGRLLSRAWMYHQQVGPTESYSWSCQ